MAGSGRRTFTPGEVLTASNVMNYLMDQSVMSFAGTAARGSAIGSAVSEGMVSYLADTNSVEVYTGSAWNSISQIQSPNVIINGGFDFWQRGTSFSNPGNGVYTSDRWSIRRDGSGFTSSFSRSALSSNEVNTTGLNYAAIYSVTSAGTSNTYNGIINKIEDVRTLENQTVTVSFWAKNVSGSSSITPIIQNWYGDGGSTQVFNTGTAISITNSWARYSQTITVTSVSGKTVGADSYNGLIFNFTPATTIQVAITGVQLEVGSTATAFRRNANSLQGELAACQRYYYRIDTANSTTNFAILGHGRATTTQGIVYVTFPVDMRVAPTSIESSASGTWRLLQNNNTYNGTSVITGAQFNTNGVNLLMSATGQTSGAYTQIEANNTKTAYVGISAEL